MRWRAVLPTALVRLLFLYAVLYSLVVQALVYRGTYASGSAQLLQVQALQVQVSSLITARAETANATAAASAAAAFAVPFIPRPADGTTYAGKVSEEWCLPHCDNPCKLLNGNLEYECGGCKSKDAKCHKDDPDFNTWRERALASKSRSVPQTEIPAPTPSADAPPAGQLRSEAPATFLRSTDAKPSLLPAASAAALPNMSSAPLPPKAAMSGIARGCRCIYVYPNPALDAFLARGRGVHQWAYGNPIDPANPTYYYAEAGTAINALLHRILTNRAEYTTDDPRAARLFVITIVPPGPPYAPWADGGKAQREAQEKDRLIVSARFWPEQLDVQLRPVCEAIWSLSAAAYAHLNAASAARHVMLTPGINSVVPMCHTKPSNGFQERTPRSADLLGRMRWLTQEMYKPSSVPGWAQYEIPGARSQLPRGLDTLALNVPYMPPTRHAFAYKRQRAHPRPYLMSFGGSLWGTTVGVQMRTKIYDECGKWGAPTCVRLTSRGPFETVLQATWVNKNLSTFCLEPGGYNDVRSAMFDALALGCIPVLFLQPDSPVLPLLAPRHWGPFLNDSLVVVSRDAYLAGKVDLKAALEAIPTARVQVYLPHTCPMPALRG